MNKFIIILLCSPFLALAQEGKTLYDKLIKSYINSKENYPALEKLYAKNEFSEKNVKNLSEVRFHPAFINMIMLHNQYKVLKLGLKDQCALVDLLNTDLLYGYEGHLKNVLISYTDKKDQEVTQTLTIKNYLLEIGYKKCPNSKKLRLAFEPRNIRKALSKSKFNYPTSQKQCLNDYENFINDPTTPYICDVVQKISNLKSNEVSLKNIKGTKYKNIKLIEKEVQDARSYKIILNPNSIEYLTKMCENAGKAEFSCHALFQMNYWKKSIDTPNSYALQYYCSQHLGKKLKKNDLLKCSNEFVNQPHLCHKLGHAGAELFPKSNCTELSHNLSQSRLFSQYQDCPAKLGLDSLVTAGRILNHISKPKEFPTFQDCTTSLIYPFLKFNEDFLADQLWQINLCYEDKLQRKTVCVPTSYDDISDSKYSLTHTMGKVLNRLRGFNNDENKCKIIYESEYRPSLLEFKTGCFIIKNEKKCSGTNCKIKVVYNDLEFNKFEIKNNLWFDLLPFKYTEENKSFIQLIEQHYKKRTRNILNISTFKAIFEKHPDAIFMGVGCLEDLSPKFAQTLSINQCTMTSFIVDGIVEENGRHSMITRTAWDNIHAPRMIPWNYIFNSVKNYQQHQPLNEWGFYAIY